MGEKKKKEKKDKEKKDKEKEKEKKKKEEKATVRSAPDGSDNHVGVILHQNLLNTEIWVFGFISLVYGHIYEKGTQEPWKILFRCNLAVWKLFWCLMKL